MTIKCNHPASQKQQNFVQIVAWPLGMVKIKGHKLILLEKEMPHLLQRGKTARTAKAKFMRMLRFALDAVHGTDH